MSDLDDMDLGELEAEARRRGWTYRDPWWFDERGAMRAGARTAWGPGSEADRNDGECLVGRRARCTDPAVRLRAALAADGVSGD